MCILYARLCKIRRRHIVTEKKKCNLKENNRLWQKGCKNIAIEIFNTAVGIRNVKRQ